MEFRDLDTPHEDAEALPLPKPYEAALQDIHKDIRPYVAAFLVITENPDAAITEEERQEREDDHAANSAWVEAARRIHFAEKGALVIDLVEPFAYKGDPEKSRITFRAVVGRDFVSGVFQESDFKLGDALSNGLVSFVQCDEDIITVMLAVKILRGKFNTPRRKRGS